MANRRLLLLGGGGALGVLALGAYYRPWSQKGPIPAPEAQAGRPTMVFVGHEL